MSRKKWKPRTCECGREMDKYCDWCSECSEARRYLNQAIYRHNYRNNNPEKHLAQMAEQNAKRKEYKNEWRRKKRMEIRDGLSGVST